MSAVCTAAVAYAKRGWQVFPAHSSGKKKSHKAAEFSNGQQWGKTGDPAEITRDFAKWPKANIGIATGAESGVFVIEADTLKGHKVDGIASLRALEAKHGTLPDTLMAISPTGSVHRYYKHPGIKVWSRSGKIAPGVDIKGDGGMVVAPPSVRSDGEYSWINDVPVAEAPAWLIGLVTAVARHKPKAKTNGADSDPPEYIHSHTAKGRGTSDDTHDLPSLATREEIERALKVIPADAEQVWFEVSVAIRQELGDDGRELFHRWSATSTKYVKDECEEKWAGAEGNSGYTARTIFHYADQANSSWRDEPKAIASETQSGLAIVRVADVEGKKVDWLWPGRIARGKLTILAGMPDVNKSTMTLDLTARVTTGGLLPAGEGNVPRGSVIILTAEDDVADTVRPRLEVAGADLARVHVIVALKATNGAGPRSFDLSQDIGRLEKAISEIGDVLLVVIDPISAYMGKPGKLDSYRSTDVRATLSPLQETAARCGVAVVGIDHLNKSGGAQAMMRVLGSVAFVAAARAVYVVVRDEEDDARRLMLPAKNNLGKIRTGLAFRVFEKLATTVFDAYPAIKWEDEPVTMTADEALANKQDGRKSVTAEAAKALIAEVLAEKPMPQTEIEQRAETQQIGHRSLTTAKKAMGVVSTKVGKAWWWSLPGKEKPM